MKHHLEFIQHRLEFLANQIQRNAYNDRLGIFIVNCKRLVAFCNETPIVRSVLDKIETHSVDFELWLQTVGYDDTDYVPYWGKHQDAHISWKALNALCSVVDDLQIVKVLGSVVTFDDRAEAPQIILNRYILPLISYIFEHLESRYLILNLLNRFIQRIHVFDRDAYYSAYQNDVVSGTRLAEYRLDKELRRFLFDQGIDCLSSPHGGTGRVDVVSTEPDKLALEVKLYCPKRLYPNDFTPKSDYGQIYLEQGFNQLYQAVISHGSTYGVLFIFNLSNESLSFETNQITFPPSINKNGKTYYILHANVYPHSSDSRAVAPPKIIDTTSWLASSRELPETVSPSDES